MRPVQLAIVSGKGGTGKTTITAALAALAPRAVLADCDVDAPNLHLLMHPTVDARQDFHGLLLASVDGDKCNLCGACHRTCRFDAMGKDARVDPAACEGCGACALACPEGAIQLVERVSGEVLTSSTRFGPMVHATLRAGEGASGKLVSEVRVRAEELSRSTGRDLIIIDGPPGTGCPVIATLSGVDLALVVAEPTPSGRQGLARAVDVAQHFKVPTCALVNRADWNGDEARAIEEWCASRGVRTLGRLPYDDAATQAMAVGRTVVEYGDGPLSRALRSLWGELEPMLPRRHDGQM
jgi:MinD superfamily P-loop ATPase